MSAILFFEILSEIRLLCQLLIGDSCYLVVEWAIIYKEVSDSHRLACTGKICVHAIDSITEGIVIAAKDYSPTAAHVVRTLQHHRCILFRVYKQFVSLQQYLNSNTELLRVRITSVANFLHHHYFLITASHRCKRSDLSLFISVQRMSSLRVFCGIFYHWPLSMMVPPRANPFQQ